MPKIFYTVNSHEDGFPVRYLSSTGEDVEQNFHSKDPGEAIDEFKALHPRVTVYLTVSEFETKKRQMAADRAKLLAWKEWAI